MHQFTDPRWFLAAGAILIAMALVGTRLRRLPLSSSMIYLAAGVALGPLGLAMIVLDPVAQAPAIELLSEVAVIVSLFTAGLKLRLPFRNRLWWLPVRLATISMTVTVGLLALVGVGMLGLPLGAAVLLGAILAPTDPVLASDVQLAHPHDTDRLRFGLTGEAGLNDGTAFPFVMLGLGLLGLHDLGQSGSSWLLRDVAWAVVAGLTVGAACGTVVARLVIHLRSTRQEAVGLDEFLALGLIGIAYGVALFVGGYGFLAVFAAGLALRHVERSLSGDRPSDEIASMASLGRDEEIATRPETAPAYMAQALLGFNEQLERIAEVALVVVTGAVLSAVGVAPAAAWFAALLFLVIRPVAVLAGLVGGGLRRSEVALFGWFGIRGIGSVYYLAYAIDHGLDPANARVIAALTLSVIAVSIVVHGVSVTPLMRRYESAIERRAQRRSRDRQGAT